MKMEENNQTPEINLFTTRQNMDTPLITEQEEDTEMINNGTVSENNDN